jgi:CheY-like chemotaxis protein
MAVILVIDDDIEMRRILRKLLEREGYQVLEASDGDEGIKLYQKNQIELIITDLLMPGKEGIETIIQLKQDFPDIKIIAMSGGGQIESEFYLECAKSFGAEYTFVKPINRKKLLTAVKELISMNPAT